MMSSNFHQIQNKISNWNVLYAMRFEKQIYNSRTFNDKNRWIIKKVMVLKKLLPHLATRGTYSPGDWRCDEALREQTLVNPPVMCQQRLIYCTWELNIMPFWKSNFKQQLGRGFDIMDNESYFFVFWHMQLYMSWYIRSFFGFTFLNILYFFKYSCTNIFHRRSL